MTLRTLLLPTTTVATLAMATNWNKVCVQKRFACYCLFATAVALEFLNVLRSSAARVNAADTMFLCRVVHILFKNCETTTQHTCSLLADCDSEQQILEYQLEKGKIMSNKKLSKTNTKVCFFCATVTKHQQKGCLLDPTSTTQIFFLLIYLCARRMRKPS